MTTRFEREAAAAAERWKSTKGSKLEPMTDAELELARAWFQHRKNSRQVRAINHLLRARISRLIVKVRADETKH